MQASGKAASKGMLSPEKTGRTAADWQAVGLAASPVATKSRRRKQGKARPSSAPCRPCSLLPSLLRAWCTIPCSMLVEAATTELLVLTGVRVRKPEMCFDASSQPT